MAAVLPFTENFTAPDGSSWSSDWTTYTNYGSDFGGSVTIQGNAGRLVSPTGYTAYSGSVAFLNMAPIANVEVTGTVVGASVVAEQYANVCINGSPTPQNLYYANDDCYFLIISYGSRVVDGTIYIFQEGPGEVNKVSAGVPLLATDKNGFRFRRVGRLLQARVWNTAAAEPTTWQVQWTIPSTDTPKTGIVALGTQTGGSATGGNFTFDDVTVSVPPLGYYGGQSFMVMKYGSVTLDGAYVAGKRSL
jgi:hypothetical protein